MKYSKAVNVTSLDIKGNLAREYDVYTNRVGKHEKHYSEANYKSKDFACQYDGNRDTVIICTCKRIKPEGYFNTSRQVYRSQRYTSARGVTDVGVGSVKTVPRKRVRRIYLPDTEDRGVGSTDLTSFIRRTRNSPCSYYDQKKTSSKCVGGLMEYNNIPVLSEKLSPICKTKSGSTSPKRTSFEEKKNNINHCIIPDPVVNLVMGKKHVKGNKTIKEQGVITQETLAHTKYADKRNEMSWSHPSKIKSAGVEGFTEFQEFSSDSLVQHIHNLENPSSYKHSKTSIDAMIENRLEREYIKMFSQISKSGKPIAEVNPVRNSTSTSLRGRFEALRRDINKKEVAAEHGIVIKSSSQNSILSRKDVSITSDPPSLEARSYTDAKIYTPFPTPSPLFKYEKVPQVSVTGKKRSSHWSTDIVDSDCQNVKGMFKLWGKKFDFEEACHSKSSPYSTPDEAIKQKKKVELILPKDKSLEIIDTQKKEGKKFSFFKRKNKEKAKQPYKSKKGLTAGRCEVGDGLTIRIGAANEFSPEATTKKCEQVPQELDNMLRKAWLKRCLDNKNDSRNSVKVRWNNEMYATSSSTVFELMECVYKNTGILFTSRSEMTTTTVPTTTTVEIPNNHVNNQQINFMQQTVQAWMIPNMITDKAIEIQKHKHRSLHKHSFSNQKWFIDKSKAFSQKIELVLHSKNFLMDDVVKSSEYIVIDIPKGYFMETSSEDEQSLSSEEQVFNIVEYETAKSTLYLNKLNHLKIDTSDHENNILITVNVNQNDTKETNVLDKEINTSLLYRDVVVQGSNVYLPKRCDVISVGIITQHTHNRDIKKPILRMQDEMTDDDSTRTIAPLKKCELAESYLQDYYRHWIPLGFDFYSWCISDSNFRASSDNNSLNSYYNQGDGSKSCPNIYDGYEASAIISSCTNSLRSQCNIVEERKADETTTTYYNKLQKKSDDPRLVAEGKRVLPKDSVEVFKRRKIYATSKEADWCTNQALEPLSKPSIQDKFAQKLSNESACDPGNQKKKIKKHVSLKDFKKIGESIMSFKGSFTCKKCNKKEPRNEHVLVEPEPTCEMVPPPCLDSCAKIKKLSFSKKCSPICHVRPPPICPVGPSPCQPVCPPVPPCASCRKESSFSPSHPNSPLNLTQTPPPTSKTSKLFSRFLSRRSKHKPVRPIHCSKCASPYLIKSPSRLESCAKVTKPACETTKFQSSCISLPKNHLRSTKSSPLTPPYNCLPPQLIQPCGCNSQKSCGLLQCPTSKTSPPASHGSCEKKQLSPNISILNLKNLPLNKNAEVLRSKHNCNSSTTEKESGDCDIGCPSKAKETSIPSTPRISPLPFGHPTLPKPRSQSKISGVHLRKLPMLQSSFSQNNPRCSIIKLNSKENLTIRMKPLTPSTEEIREGCNIKVKDDDGQTLYERREYKMDTAKARKYLVQDMYRDSQIHRVSTSKADIMNEKSSEPCKSKSNTSLSNIVEINLNLKFKQADKTADVSIKKCGVTSKDNQNEKLNSQSSTEIYTLQDKTSHHQTRSFDRIEDAEKGDVNIKIIINSYQENANKSKRRLKHPNVHVDKEFSRKISEKFHTVSTGYSNHLDPQTYSIHEATANFNNSADVVSKNIFIPNEELVQNDLVEKGTTNFECVTTNSQSEPSVTLVTVNKTKNVDSEVLPCDNSHNKYSEIKLENTVYTFDEKSGTGISTTENEEVLFSDVQHLDVKLPKIRNKKEKKKILKQIFDGSINVKNTPNKNKMQSIQKMLRAVLTSDSSGYEDDSVNNELTKELAYESLKPNFFKDSVSMTNYYQNNNSSVSENRSSLHEIEDILHPTEINNSFDSVESTNENSHCLCNHMAAKLNIECEKKTACCCRIKAKRDEETDCNLIEDAEINKAAYVDVETQDSTLKTKVKQSNATIESYIAVMQPEKVKKKRNLFGKIPTQLFSYSSSVKMCKLNRQTVLGLSDDDKVIVLNSELDNSKSQQKSRIDSAKLDPIDILQLYETKKAVLEIYAEKAFNKTEEHLVAKLPKFIYKTESGIYNYEKWFTDIHEFSAELSF